MPIPRQANGIHLKITDVKVGDRVRADYGDMDVLCKSIADHGLIQPIVVDQHNNLLAGGRRLKAHQLLEEQEIAVVYYETLDDLQRRILEVEENVARKDFDWKERCVAIANVHELAKRDAILTKNAKQWTQEQTGELLGISLGSVNNALVVARYLRSGDKDIGECETMRDALQLLLLRKEQEAQKRLASFITNKANSSTAVNRAEVDKLLNEARADDFFTPVAAGGSGGGVSAPVVDEMPGRRLAGVVQAPGAVPLSKLCVAGDCFTVMSTMPAESVDHIITDIPYGIDMDNLSNVESVRDEHTVASNVEDFADFMAETFRVLRPNAYNIFWCDVEHWEKLRDAAYAVGYKVQRWPLVWHKTSPCRNQAAQFNFTKNYEIAMVLRKGTPTLVQPMSSSVWAGPNESDLDHPFAKPALLWQWLINAVAISGQVILDPYAGVGSFAVAAIPCGVVPISIEMKDIHYNKLVENVQNAYKRLSPDVTFV